MKPEAVKLPRAGQKRKSPTELTLEFLRSRNWFCGIVERRNPAVRNRTHDLFQIIDIIALTSEGVLGVQSTGTDFSEHWKKLTITHAKASARWLSVPGNRLMLIGWRDVKDGRKPRIRMIRMRDLIPALKLQRVDPDHLVAGSVFSVDVDEGPH